MVTRGIRKLAKLTIDLTETPADRDWIRAARFKRLAEADDAYAAAVWQKMQEKDTPYTLGEPADRAGRRRLLDRPHVAPLTKYVKKIRTATGRGAHVPYFDPRDGGVEAKVLVLMEAPGPNAVETRFVSCDNPDPTARNLFNILFDAGMPRSRIVIWNIVPWYIGKDGHIRAAKAADIKEGKPHLKSLMALLPRLAVVVLLGRNAQKIAPWLTKQVTGIELIKAYHPSNRVLNMDPKKRDGIVMAFKEAACLT